MRLDGWGISHANLTDHGTSLIQRLIREGHVSKGPERARARLALAGIEPELTGESTPTIRWLRDCIADLGGVKLANALMITAPHTHWRAGAIVIWRPPRSRAYRIGPVGFAPVETRFAPVSFVFTTEGAMPHEWADTRLLGSRRDYDAVVAAIAMLNDRLKEGPLYGSLALGVSLAARFKALFDPPLFGTMEVPDDEGPLARIIRDQLSDRASMETGGQVGWSAHRPPAQAAPSEREAAEALAGALRAMPVRKAREVYRVLKRMSAHTAA